MTDSRGWSFLRALFGAAVIASVYVIGRTHAPSPAPAPACVDTCPWTRRQYAECLGDRAFIDDWRQRVSRDLHDCQQTLVQMAGERDGGRP